MPTNDKNEKDYLKEMAPRLFSEEMKEARDIPEGYFDSVESQVLAKIKLQAEPKGKVQTLINFRNLSIAAGLALLMALIPLMRDQTTPRAATIETEMETISEDAAQLYLAEEYDLESIAADIAFESIVISENDQLTEQEILNYLIDSEISESLIYESL